MKHFISVIVLFLGCFQLVHAASGRIFITNERSNDISVIDGASLEIEKTIEVGDRPRGLASHRTAQSYTSRSVKRTSSRSLT